LQTGCRFGELARLIVSDFNSDTGTAFVQKPKAGKSRHVILTEEGVDLFARLSTGRAGNERILRREWYNSAATRNARDLTAREDLAANIVPRIEAHLGVACCDECVPLQVIAQNLGHTDTRMVEKHYGHTSRSHVADAIRAGAPRFSVVKKTNVRRLAHGRR